MIDIRAYRPADREAVVALWRDGGLLRPWNDPYRDIDRCLASTSGWLTVADDGGEPVGAVMVGYDGHRGWLYYLATSTAHRGRGIGRRLVEDAERRLAALGCPKVQLMVRPDNAAVRGFYEALGYDHFETWATGKRLIHDDDAP